MNFRTALLFSTLVFLSFLVWKVRPQLFDRRRLKSKRGALSAAKERVEKTRDPQDRALALCDVGDLCAGKLGRSTAAVGYYLRAMRADPTSTVVIDRAALTLEHNPRALES